METLVGWTGLILGFSGLIFIHELGHFLLAKWNGVRVHVFSVGMGPYLVSFTHNGTVYALSAIPMGGYVKMMGQDDLNADLSADKNPADFRNKRPGQKAAILAAGAAFNILTTIFIYTCVYWSGMWVQPPSIGNVLPDKPLAKATIFGSSTPANLKKGDRILEVGDTPVKSFFDLMLQVTAYPIGKPIYLTVQRKDGNYGARPDVVQVDMEEDKKQGVPNIGLGAASMYKEEEPLALGFTTELFLAVTSNPSDDKKTKDMPAGKTGLFRKGDRILRLEDRTRKDHPVVIPMDSEYALPNAAAASKSADREATKGEPRVFIIERGTETVEIPLIAEIVDGSARFGLGFSPFKRVTHIDNKSEAFNAGLREGDLVSFHADSPHVHPWKSGKLLWVKNVGDEKPQEAKMTVPATEGHDAKDIFQQDFIVEEEYRKPSFFEAMGAAWDDTRRYTVCMFATLRNLFTGHVKAKNLSGPVGIGSSIFAVASEQSPSKYFWFLAFISLNLGVMQLLPIPLLDGFHLVMVAAEKIKGSAVNAKVQEYFMYAGLAIIGSLLMYVMFNDVSRFFPA